MMRTSALAVVLVALGVGLYLVPFGSMAPAETAQGTGAPVKLAVVVVFDQMRGDYVEKWREFFGEGGFKRLQDQGACFTQCYYPYGTTTTAPGHASILAGRGGDKHGIVNNSWYDRLTAAEVTAATSARYELVPPAAAGEATKGVTTRKASAVGNPDRFQGETLADVVKSTTKGKVFGLSLKDRAALFPVGKSPDGAYWFTGRFATSTFYRDSLPRWVSDFNSSGAAEQWFGKTWERLRPDLDYVKIVGPDDGLGEGVGPKPKATTPMGKTFPHPLSKPGATLAEAGAEKEKTTLNEYYENLTCSPYGNDLLWELAKKCIVAENLGKDDAPDLLTISFSSNDIVGHAWGPDSHEVFDVTLRSDRLMAEMLKFLDAQVGPGNYSVTVTADHGICPNPEVSAAKGLDAKRISPKVVADGMEQAMVAKYGAPKEVANSPIVGGPAPARPGPAAAPAAPPAPSAVDAPKAAAKEKTVGKWIEAFSMPNVYLNRRALDAASITPEAAATVVAEWLRTQPGIDRAYTAGQFAAAAPAGDALFPIMKKSFYAANSGDLVIVSKPLYLLDTYGTGTTHGAPHDYDRHTVFLVYGPGVRGGMRSEPITPLHAGVINAGFMNVRPPQGNEYAMPATLK